MLEGPNPGYPQAEPLKECLGLGHLGVVSSWQVLGEAARPSQSFRLAPLLLDWSGEGLEDLVAVPGQNWSEPVLCGAA